jgi:hypothetical protein
MFPNEQHDANQSCDRLDSLRHAKAFGFTKEMRCQRRITKLRLELSVFDQEFSL